MKRINVSLEHRVLWLVIAGCLALPVYAVEDYRNEVSHVRVKTSYQGDDELSSSLTSIEHYIRPVIISQGIPRNEAAFLQRSGSIGIGVGDQDGVFNTTIYDASTSDQRASVTLAEKGKPWLLQWSYLKLKGDASSPNDTDIKSEMTTYSIGYYIQDGILFSISQGQNDIEFSSSPVDDAKVTRFEYALKWVTLRSGQTATMFELSVENEREKDGSGSRNGQVFAVSGEYYFSPDSSLGVLYAQKTHDDKEEEGTRTELRGSYFVTPRFFVGASIGRFQAGHSSGVDEEIQDLFIGYRF